MLARSLLSLLLLESARFAAPVAVARPSIYFKNNVSQAAPFGLSNGGGCQVLYLYANEDIYLPSGQPINLKAFDAIFTDAHDLVPWGTTASPMHFHDASEYPHQPGRELYESKRGLRSLSFLVPQTPQSEEMLYWIQEAYALVPNDVYVDRGTPESRRPAFEGYAFSLLLSVDSKIPPPQILESVALSAVPMLVWTVPHFINYTVYFPYTVGKFRQDRFSPEFALKFVNGAHDDAIYVMQSSLMLVQDFFYFRYSLTFHWRLHLHTTRICEDAALPAPLRTDIFIAIYSAKANFARRRALRETWLSLLQGPLENFRSNRQPADPIFVAHRFFMNALGAGDPLDPATSTLDDALRSEAEVFSDLVFLEALEEYPIGNMGRLALHWIANHTAAPYILKIDDDMYVRPVPLLRLLARQQKAMLYWGFFERSGLVVRDPESAHFLPADLFGHDGVFPPYARGAALAMSLDLVRLIAHYDRLGVLRRLKVEDASYGYYLWQLVIMGLTSVTIADREESHFALDPKCCTEKTHPNNCWSPLTSSTWVVHHVGPRAVRCMFRTDIENGYYVQQRPRQLDPRKCLSSEALSELTPGDDAGGGVDGVRQACAQTMEVEPLQDPEAYEPSSIISLPSLCGCVRTPPPHPDQPKPGPLFEGKEGPRLHVR